MMRSHGAQDRSHRDPGSHGIAWVGLPLSRTGVLVTHSALRFLVIVLLLLAVPAASGARSPPGSPSAPCPGRTGRRRRPPPGRRPPLAARGPTGAPRW